MKNSLFTALLIAFELHQSDLETIICNTIFKMNIAIALLHFSPQTSVQFSFKLETMPLDFRRSKSILVYRIDKMTSKFCSPWPNNFFSQSKLGMKLFETKYKVFKTPRLCFLHCKYLTDV